MTLHAYNCVGKLFATNSTVPCACLETGEPNYAQHVNSTTPLTAGVPLRIHSVDACGTALARAANIKEIVRTKNFIAREDCVKFLQNLLHFIGLGLHIQHSLYSTPSSYSDSTPRSGL